MQREELHLKRRHELDSMLTSSQKHAERTKSNERHKSTLRHSDIALMTYAALVGFLIAAVEAVKAKYLDIEIAVLAYILTFIFALVWLRLRRREDRHICDECNKPDRTFTHINTRINNTESNSHE